MVFDPTEPEVDHALLLCLNIEFGQLWNGNFDLTKILPANMEEPRGFDCPMCACVDADHATDSSAMTRKSHTGLLIYLNNMPTLKRARLVLHSSMQWNNALNNIVAYVFSYAWWVSLMGSLHIMSLVIPSKSVLDHNAIPELTLRKKSQSMAYQPPCATWMCSRWVACTAYVNTHLNPPSVDLLTKSLSLHG